MEKFNIVRDEIGIKTVDIEDWEIGERLNAYDYLSSDFLYSYEYDREEFEDLVFEELVKKVSLVDEEQLVRLKNRALAHIVNAIINQRGLYANDEWKEVRREIFKKSGIKELISSTLGEMLSKNEDNIFFGEKDFIKTTIQENDYYQGLVGVRKQLEDQINIYNGLSDADIKENLTKLSKNKTEEQEEYPENLEEYRYLVEERSEELGEKIEIIDNNVKDYPSTVQDFYYSNILQEKEKNYNALDKSIKKRFVLFLINKFYPDLDVNNIDSSLITDIYAAVTDTEAWLFSTASFKEEFDEMLNKKPGKKTRK